MNIQDLFSTTSKVLNQNDTELTNNFVDTTFISLDSKEKSFFIPDVDFSNPKNFAKYGSAEEYYSAAFFNIYSSYPYDGSLTEVYNWFSKLTFLDRYIAKNIHPRAVGHLYLSNGAHVSIVPSVQGNKPTEVFSPEKSRELRLDFVSGVTVEFWLKSAEVTEQKIFKLANNDRNLEIFATNNNSFKLKINGQNIFFSLSGNFLTSWNHYAFSLKNYGNNTVIKFYKNGLFIASQIIPSQTNTLSPYYAEIGSGVSNNAIYVDEFRFWLEEKEERDLYRYHFDRVYGETNTSTTSNKLAVYYRFNEGIVPDDKDPNWAQNSIVLDYSGAVLNGYIKNYTSAVRKEASAIDESQRYKQKEIGDYILNTNNKILSDVLDAYKVSGKAWDLENKNSLIYFYPTWVQAQENKDKDKHLTKLMQIIASYFDMLHLQISSVPEHLFASYTSDNKPLPFINSMLESEGLNVPDLFLDVKVIELLRHRDDKNIFEKRLDEVKNLIYKNIYNNISFLFKSKGTEKAFRNIMRSFGVDEDIVKLAFYADRTKYKLFDSVRENTSKVKVLNFSKKDTFTSYIKNLIPVGQTKTGNIDGIPYYAMPITFEAEVFFEKKDFTDDYNDKVTDYERSSDLTLSIFACLDQNNKELFKLNLVKQSIDSVGGYFEFYSGITGETKKSDFIFNIFNDEKWTFAVRLYPENDIVQKIKKGSPQTADFYAELYAVNTVGNKIKNTFTCPLRKITYTEAVEFHNASKTFNIGSYGGKQTDMLLSAARLWADYISNEEINKHSRDSANRGVENPTSKPYEWLGEPVRRTDLCILDWQFDQVSKIGASGEYILDDNRPKVAIASEKLSEFLNQEYTSVIYGPANTAITKKHFYLESKQELPENLFSSDTINILGEEDYIFKKDSGFIGFFLSFEKSMYRSISEEILTFFSGVTEFNDIVGDRVNTYRVNYRELDALRTIFFSKVKNVPSLEKYLEYYRWVDSSLGSILHQFTPAAIDSTDRINNVIEDHVLSRSKIEWKIINSKKDTVRPGIIRGIKELKYYKDGITNAAPATPNKWSKERARRTDATLFPLYLPSAAQLAEKAKNSSINETGFAAYKLFNGSVAYEKSMFSERKLARVYDLVTEDSIRKTPDGGAIINIFRTKNEEGNFDSGGQRKKIKKPLEDIQPFSYSLVKNFFYNYNIVQTVGREINNRWLIQGYSIDELPSRVYTAVDLQPNSIIKNFVKPEYASIPRKANKTIFVNRFSSPGSKESMSYLGLDLFSNSLSAYSTVNFRNLFVRKVLKNGLATPYLIDIYDDAHYTHKNRLEVPSSLLTSRSRYDNGYISHQIPSKDLGYSWIYKVYLESNLASQFYKNGPYFSIYKNLSITDNLLKSLASRNTEVATFAATTRYFNNNILNLRYDNRFYLKEQQQSVLEYQYDTEPAVQWNRQSSFVLQSNTSAKLELYNIIDNISNYSIKYYQYVYNSSVAYRASAFYKITHRINQADFKLITVGNYIFPRKERASLGIIKNKPVYPEPEILFNSISPRDYLNKRLYSRKVYWRSSKDNRNLTKVT